MTSRYKYSSRIAKTILKVIDDVPLKHEDYKELKRKGTKYSNKSEKKNFYVIREKAYEIFLKEEPPRNPSRSHYQVTFDELVKIEMVEELEEKQPKEFIATDMGHICNKYDYDPKDYKTFYLIWALVCFRASIGMLGSSSTKPGIVPMEILEYESRINLPHVDTYNIEFHLDELKEHFDLLVKHKILKKIGEAETERFDINQKYKKFILTSNTIFLKLLKERMEFRWAHVHRPESKEKEWYQTTYGNQVTKEKTTDLARQLTINKGKGSEQKKRWEKELISYDKEVIDDYYNLLKEDDELDDIQGFVETILSIVCPKDLIELIELEYDVLKSKN